jgi:hypothetical protein
VVLDVCERAFQDVAIRREGALERDDLISNIHFCCRHLVSLSKPRASSVRTRGARLIRAHVRRA